jgi:hypothetical protein
VLPVVASRVPPAVVQALSLARYKVQFTATAELCDKLERLRPLMRGEVPDGDLATVIEQAVTEKLELLEARRFARTNNPRKRPSYTRTNAPRKRLSKTDRSPSSRYISAAFRRAVFERDGGRCRYADGQGRRCPERSRLEYHHRVPSPWVVTTASRTSASCVGVTTAIWPNTTTAGRRCYGTDVQRILFPMRCSSTGRGARCPEARKRGVRDARQYIAW